MDQGSGPRRRQRRTAQSSPGGIAAAGASGLVGADNRDDDQDRDKEKQGGAKGGAMRVLVEETVESIGEHG
jgi:hypothetical protein